MPAPSLRRPSSALIPLGGLRRRSLLGSKAVPLLPTKPRGGGGRKKGSGSFAGKDKPLLELMKPLIADGKAHWAAAMEVVDKAAGAGTDESKAKRLVKRFKEWEKTTQFI